MHWYFCYRIEPNPTAAPRCWNHLDREGIFLIATLECPRLKRDAFGDNAAELILTRSDHGNEVGKDA